MPSRAHILPRLVFKGGGYKRKWPAQHVGVQKKGWPERSSAGSRELVTVLVKTHFVTAVCAARDNGIGHRSRTSVPCAHYIIDRLSSAAHLEPHDNLANTSRVQMQLSRGPRPSRRYMACASLVLLVRHKGQWPRQPAAAGKDGQLPLPPQIRDLYCWQAFL